MEMFRKNKPSIDEILAGLDELNDEERQKVKERLEKKIPDEEMIEKAEKDEEEKDPDEESDEIREKESVGEQIEEEGDKDSQTTEDRIDESEGTEKADEMQEKKEDDSDEVRKLLTELEARLSALENANSQTVEEEIGTDSDFADDINPQMPASYTEQAKKMRY